MVKVLFDTSILIAGFVASHPHHQAALPWLQKAKTKEIEVLPTTKMGNLIKSSYALTNKSIVFAPI